MNTRLRAVLAFSAILLGYFMALLDTTIVNIALPEMTRYFGGTVSQISWVMNGYNLAFAALILTASRLADQFGRKKIFILGLVLFTLSSLLAGLSNSLGMLILFRVIQGLAGAIIVPVTIPLTTTTFPKEKHGMIIGIWGAIAGLAAASGPSLGGILTEKLNWQWIFYVNVPLGLLSILLTLLFIKESRDETAGKSVDYGGMFSITAGMLFITYAFIKANDYGWNSAEFYALLGAGLIFTAVFFYLQSRGKEAMLPLGLLKIKEFNGTSLALFIVGAALSNLTLLTSFFLTREMGMTELKAGLVLSILAAGSIISSAVSGGLSNKYGSRWFGVAGVAVICGAIYAMSNLDDQSPLSDVLLRLFIAGIGVGLTMAPVMSAGVRHVPEEKVGIASGVMNMTKAIGSVLGVAVIVTLLQQSISGEMQAAQVRILEQVKESQGLMPVVKEVLVAVVDEQGSRKQTESGSELQEEEVAGQIVKELEMATAKLDEEQQKAFAATRDDQMQEVKLLLTSAGSDLKQASVNGFRKSFIYASLMLLPGIIFAWMSDKRRAKKDSGQSTDRSTMKVT
ncbi:MFS transporter [Paenibacillus motobuensis]|uniref:MFS transporter n=1 Tax=Paenibacillus TaxID=44249 RepID=UPI00203AFF44|nr:MULTISPECIES: MFS transporter [Paenibacillus]MCM3038147.1 MFS transporter [Paenibacillus lutimineralis]MCM3645251.1 MFS transporter [Paenibacillus motobuensis]